MDLVRVLGHEMPRAQIQAKWEIGIASEDMRLYAGRTIEFHFDLMRSIYDCWDGAFSMEMLARFDLEIGQKIKGHSHGQRVRAALLLAFARRSKRLAVEEPTTGRDPVARKETPKEVMRAMED